MTRFDAIANDSTTNISRNRVSFNMSESDKKKQNGLEKLSAAITRKMSSTPKVFLYKIIR
jgi:hypothetical protein